MKVFLVEDSIEVRRRLVDLVNSVPGTVIAGESSQAQDAISRILGTHPDVVVCDLRLDQGTGFDVLRAVGRQAPEIDFYMLSNFAEDGYRQLSARLGARDFFDKANEFERVREIIAERAASRS